jgi:hypothetical protein
MIRRFTLLLLTMSFAGPAVADSRTVTWTGWFSDRDCAAPRVARGEFGPNGTTCVKKCLDRGVAAVFVSEQARGMFAVNGYATVKEDVGYYVKLTGVVDEGAKTISVTSVERLSEIGGMCGVPSKRKK